MLAMIGHARCVRCDMKFSLLFLCLGSRQKTHVDSSQQGHGCFAGHKLPINVCEKQLPVKVTVGVLS
jgi:hypothetical protein